jgi:hypothetical protein
MSGLTTKEIAGFLILALLLALVLVFLCPLKARVEEE